MKNFKVEGSNPCYNTTAFPTYLSKPQFFFYDFLFHSFVFRLNCGIRNRFTLTNLKAQEMAISWLTKYPSTCFLVSSVLPVSLCTETVPSFISFFHKKFRFSQIKVIHPTKRSSLRQQENCLPIRCENFEEVNWKVRTFCTHKIPRQGCSIKDNKLHVRSPCVKGFPAAHLVHPILEYEIHFQFFYANFQQKLSSIK